MKNGTDLVSRICGTPAPTVQPRAKRTFESRKPASYLQRVLGESDDEGGEEKSEPKEDKEEKKSPPSDSGGDDAPESKAPEGESDDEGGDDDDAPVGDGPPVGDDIEGEEGLEGGLAPDDGVVTLLSAGWEAGAQDEVIKQAKTQITTYSQLIKLAFAIGEEGAFQLAAALDADHGPTGDPTGDPTAAAVADIDVEAGGDFPPEEGGADMPPEAIEGDPEGAPEGEADAPPPEPAEDEDGEIMARVAESRQRRLGRRF